MKCVVFDLDGTLAESKQAITPIMAQKLKLLLSKKQVAIITGGTWSQIQKQVLSKLSLNTEECLNLHLFPTNATSFYTYVSGDWCQVYSESFTNDEKRLIIDSLKQSLVGFEKPAKTWGEQIEDRNSQITFSALGQSAPYDVKKNWDPTFEKRLSIIEKLIQLLPQFEIRAGGATSIDVTKKGIDKKYGISQIEKNLGVSVNEMIFIGDALFPGGNDHPVKETGIFSIEVSDPSDTLSHIDDLLRKCDSIT